MNANIELKARLDDHRATLATAERLATDDLGVQRQVDTYFHCQTGRLKLREIDDREAQLIWYRRGDSTAARESQYTIAPVGDPASLRQALSAAWGVRGEVRKARRILLYHNVRIHLDEVENLGHFLEFEAVLGPEDDEAVSRRRLDALLAAFDLAAHAWLGESYSDLLGL